MVHNNRQVPDQTGCPDGLRKRNRGLVEILSIDHFSWLASDMLVRRGGYTLNLSGTLLPGHGGGVEQFILSLASRQAGIMPSLTAQLRSYPRFVAGARYRLLFGVSIELWPL
jgi:hypothetical protein